MKTQIITENKTTETSTCLRMQVKTYFKNRGILVLNVLLNLARKVLNLQSYLNILMKLKPQNTTQTQRNDIHHVLLQSRP